MLGAGHLPEAFCAMLSSMRPKEKAMQCLHFPNGLIKHLQHLSRVTGSMQLSCSKKTLRPFLGLLEAPLLDF